MNTLQNKAFWRLKRTVLENQLFHVEKRTDVATLFQRSGATPVVVSELDKAHRESDPGRLEIYRNRY